MAVHTFGAVSSPSIANFVLKTAADKDTSLDNRVSQTIKRNFYVDDCLKAVPDVECATSLVAGVTKALADAGFRLTKFISNSKEVLKSLPESDRAVDCSTFDLEHASSTTRALGLVWQLRDDVFKFSANVPDKPATRRGILSTISSLYDPLGFLAPVILPTKQILQALCQQKDLLWDQVVPLQYAARWQSWLADLPSIGQLSIPRSFKPSTFGKVKTAELHVFSDASTSGYGVAAYLVLANEEGIRSCLVMGKSRIAPLKFVTIPRLELTAATVAVKVAHTLLREFDMKIHRVLYYTDSTAVLHFIHSESKRFPVFIANRVKTIRDFSSPHQWNFVETCDNPADIASRGVKADTFVHNDLWFHGPRFLTASDVKLMPTPQCSDCQIEHNVISNATSTAAESSEAFHKLIVQYSSWYRLKRAVAIFGRFLLFLQNKSAVVTSLTTTEIKSAESAIIRYVQKVSFPEEMRALSAQGKSVKKTSCIYRLDPFISPQDGILRVGGRLHNAHLSHDTMHPVLLPKKSHVTLLVIRSIHEKIGHAGRNHVLSILRESFWVINANSVVRNVLYHCVKCRKLRGPLLDQMMSDLPQDRVEPCSPFTNTGVDCFGPFHIKEGRKEIKRYGVLFTCLVTRAIHLETVNSLETDSFINALRRFISRRGHPKLIRSDNGTNFRGAERQIKTSMQELSNEHIHEYLLKENIEWHFNPPSASHMGGVWERQIRSVRKVLSALIQEHGMRLNDECLRTLLCEVESIVNSRPLTTVSDSVDDLEPLTPNHALMVKSQYVLPPPGVFQKNDIYLRRRWRSVQYLTNLFWTRWRKEYLPTLKPRQKWNTPKRNVKAGDIVLVRTENEPRNSWPMGRILSTRPDKNGVVRSAIIRTQLSKMERPVHKLVLLISE